MKVKLTLSYDGTNYCGWQVQPNGITVQEELEKALEGVDNKTEVDEKYPQGNSNDDSLDHSEKDSLTYCTNYLKQFSK